jgi:5S rRNA maturation endonuclease (ribonuclease M5)
MYGSRLLSKEAVLKEITPYDIFKYYIPNFKKLGIKFRSELRKDNAPTCSIKLVGVSFLYRDFAEFETLDCFSYVMKKFGISFHEALKLIDKDFNLGLSNEKIDNYTPPPKYEIEKIKEESVNVCEITIVKRAFSKVDELYWFKKYGIKLSLLKNYSIYPISGFYKNGIYYRCDAVAYAYEFDTEEGIFYKIYQPYSKIKWLSNCPKKYLQGINNLIYDTSVLFITKALKDVIILNLLDYNAVAPNSETMYFDDYIDFFKANFKRIILLYDNDAPGEKASKIIAEKYNIETLFLPKEIAKDCSDFVEKKSLIELENYLNDKLNLSSSNTTI